MIRRPLTFTTTAITSWRAGFFPCVHFPARRRLREPREQRRTPVNGRGADCYLIGEVSSSLLSCVTIAPTAVRTAGGSRGRREGVFCFPGISAVGLSTAAADLPDLQIHLKALPHGPRRTNRLRPFNIFPRQLWGFLGPVDTGWMSLHPQQAIFDKGR